MVPVAVGLALLAATPCRPNVPLPLGLHVWASGGGSRAGMWIVCVDADAALEARPAFGPAVTRRLTSQEQVRLAGVVERLPKEQRSYTFGALVVDGDDYSILVRLPFATYEYTLASMDDGTVCTAEMQSILRALAYFWELAPGSKQSDPREAYKACWSVAGAH